MPRDSNSHAPREHSVLQTGAANRIRLTPRNWQRAWESNPVVPLLTLASLAVRWVTVPLALCGTGARIRTVCACFGGTLLSQEHPDIGRRWRDRTPMLLQQPTVFKTVRRPFSGTFCMSKNWWERRGSNSHGRSRWFLKPVRIPVPPRSLGLPGGNRTHDGWFCRPTLYRLATDRLKN